MTQNRNSGFDQCNFDNEPVEVSVGKRKILSQGFLKLFPKETLYPGNRMMQQT